MPTGRPPFFLVARKRSNRGFASFPQGFPSRVAIFWRETLTSFIVRRFVDPRPPWKRQIVPPNDCPSKTLQITGARARGGARGGAVNPILRAINRPRGYVEITLEKRLCSRNPGGARTIVASCLSFSQK